MRISDWSSAVCSSELAAYRQSSCPSIFRAGLRHPTATGPLLPEAFECPERENVGPAGNAGRCSAKVPADRLHDERRRPRELPLLRRRTGRYRSEEHTSELQSLMRISYAVFCLKKKNR